MSGRTDFLLSSVDGVSQNTTVSADWLVENLDHAELVILDASMEKSVSDSPPAIENTYIPGSRRFDFEKTIRDLDSDLPHMLPTAEVFENEMNRLGVGSQHTIVVYGNRGTYASPRAWWMLKAMGHERVAVLDGGIPEWVRLGHPTVESHGDFESSGGYAGDFQASRVVDFAGVSQSTSEDTSADATLVVDARSSGRFEGTEPEPRAGLRSGHIPTSKSVPFSEVLNGVRLADRETLCRIFGELTDDSGSRVIATCGSGVTACVLALAAEVAGFENVSVYDGSWAEFGRL